MKFKYLMGLNNADAAKHDVVKMIYETSKGMLHEQGVLHGDLNVQILERSARQHMEDRGETVRPNHNRITTRTRGIKTTHSTLGTAWRQPVGPREMLLQRRNFI